MKELLFSLIFLVAFVMGCSFTLAIIFLFKKHELNVPKEETKILKDAKVITKDVMSEWFYGESKGDDINE